MGNLQFKDHRTQGADRATSKCSEPDCKDSNTGKVRLYHGQSVIVMVPFQSQPVHALPLIICKWRGSKTQARPFLRQSYATSYYHIKSSRVMGSLQMYLLLLHVLTYKRNTTETCAIIKCITGQITI